ERRTQQRQRQRTARGIPTSMRRPTFRVASPPGIPAEETSQVLTSTLDSESAFKFVQFSLRAQVFDKPGHGLKILVEQCVIGMPSRRDFHIARSQVSLIYKSEE